MALPKSADIVIIGGGVMGASLLYHLAARGQNRFAKNVGDLPAITRDGRSFDDITFGEVHAICDHVDEFADMALDAVDLVGFAVDRDGVPARANRDRGVTQFERREKSVLRSEQSNHGDTVDLDVEARDATLRQGNLRSVRQREREHERERHSVRRLRRC